jgi:hypothetical protein
VRRSWTSRSIRAETCTTIQPAMAVSEAISSAQRLGSAAASAESIQEIYSNASRNAGLKRARLPAKELVPLQEQHRRQETERSKEPRAYGAGEMVRAIAGFAQPENGASSGSRSGPQSATNRRSGRPHLGTQWTSLRGHRRSILNANASVISSAPAHGSALLAHTGSGLADTVNHY